MNRMPPVLNKFLRSNFATFLFVSVMASGCGGLQHQSNLIIPPGTQLENPLFVGLPDGEFVWNQIVDSVDDYFLIEREERMRQLGSVITEGRLYTLPTAGSTYFEPWLSDSSPGFEKAQSTLQSTRRQAFVRVTPNAEGYLIEVVVSKELEDLFQPEFSSVGGSVQRHDGSVERSSGGTRDDTSVSLGWIPLGRDHYLEQRILLDLQSRFTNAR
ncbi:MAG: hypothetical protein ABGX22_27700 [Pirellulaceae bacterium]|jgi:hypothetical protein|nr:hypothetical protein [Planctomycetaceae bacterium]